MSLSVLRRNGQVTIFDDAKIKIAMRKAFIASEGQSAANAAHVVDAIENLTKEVVYALNKQYPHGGTVHIEDIQDNVEKSLMTSGHHSVARLYILYREERATQRNLKTKDDVHVQKEISYRVKYHGELRDLDLNALRIILQEACINLDNVNSELILKNTLRNLYDGVPFEHVLDSAILSTRTLIEHNPDYSFVAARILLHALREEVLKQNVFQHDMQAMYIQNFQAFIQKGVDFELLNKDLLNFDLNKIANALDASRDLKINYLGLQTLYDRYFLHIKNTKIELPQFFFMRVAMGLALQEKDRENKAIEFYHLLSSFDFMSSTPTLFNSATLRSQLSSCYLTTISDNLEGIYDALKENALLSKWAGGLGNDWSNVRALGSWIKGTNGKSQGVIPFLKVANDTLVAVNQCFSPSTLVHTAHGPQEISHIQVGDLVLGISGKYRSVLKKMVYNQKDAMLSIKAKHSLEPMQVTDGHPFYAIQNVPMGQNNSRTLSWLHKNKVKALWVDAKQLKNGDYIAQVIPKEVNVIQGFNAEDARFYGILLGQGNISQNRKEFGIGGNPQKDEYLSFVKDYLCKRGIHFWTTQRGQTYQQIRWANQQDFMVYGRTGTDDFSSEESSHFAFNEHDLYDKDGEKYIAARFSHLPPEQTLALIHGLIETKGNVSRPKEINFTSNIKSLAEGLRYQCLRLGIPTSGNMREREQSYSGERIDGSKIEFTTTISQYDIRIPAIKQIADLFTCKAIRKKNWLNYQGFVFTRIRDIQNIEPTAFVCDLKVEGDESYMTTSALAHNGGKRLGSGCAYLETWHLDIEEFLDLRKNTGDDRRRCHDMNTANWIPDLFMKRVLNKQSWTLFSPSDVPDLHDLYGEAFESAYLAYEEKAKRGEIALFRGINALDLWRKMLTMLFETGHPWITFKDACNIRNPQQHMGVIHSSNLCTEITLNTGLDEIAVCNLGSVNLVNHIVKQENNIHGKNGWGLDMQKLEATIKTAIRMLDNVIDINYYPVEKARNSNMRHRPIGLGMMGFQDCLHKMGIAYASQDAIDFADISTEAVCYFAYQASSELAKERGAYNTYAGSLWSQGILPKDSMHLLEKQRGTEFLQVDKTERLDWNALRQHIQQYGMRNSNCVAIAPTATISNIIGVSASIEPNYQNLYVKSNLSGEFTMINQYLVKDLQKLDLWDDMMIADIKYFDGSLAQIPRIPEHIKQIYATAFEVDANWLVECAARRQKWIDQAQSLNIYVKGINGKKLDEIYRLAWVRGLKTTYYLRTMGATHAEKSTIHTGALNAVASSTGVANDANNNIGAACYLRPGDKGFEECEACQ
jgi:ribonucleoside-diphosphate reductase alpha chain